MPTNLPPEYSEAEERYKAASTPQEKITRLQELISTVPKHKGTDKLRADLRKRLSKLKADAETKKGVSRHVSAFQIEKEGAAQVSVIGTPNVGKSALVAAVTNATPEVASFPCSTWSPTPGMMLVDHAPIQLIDTPPLQADYVEPAMMDLLRRSDLLLLLIDLQADPLGQLEESIALLQKHKIQPIFDPAREPNGEYPFTIPAIIAVNKYDGPHFQENLNILQALLEDDLPLLPISATTGYNLDQLKNKIFDRLQLIRVYSRPPGEEADHTAPFVLKKGSTVEDFAAEVHQDFYEHLKSARIWGSGSFQGQMVSRDHVLWDGDEIELRI